MSKILYIQEPLLKIVRSNIEINIIFDIYSSLESILHFV